MKKRKVVKNSGFTLTEVLIVISIAVIIAIIAIPNIRKYYSIYKSNEKVKEVESALKWARLVAMERTTNIGLCVENNQLKIIDMGTSRSGICTGSILRTIKGTQDIIISGSGSAFDPRGLAIFSGSISVNSSVNCVRFTIQTLRGFIDKQPCG